MELEHRFELPVGVDKAFPALLDLDLIGPCFPGATVDSVNGDEFTGSVKVKIGPIPLNYKGTARFVEKNYETHTAVIEANGAAPRSGSTATMLVNASATAVAPNRTAIVLVTTLSITGRAANFGRQAMIDVGNELIGKFADCVANKLAGRTAGGVTLLGVINPDAVAAELGSVEDAAPAATGTAAAATVSATAPSETSSRTGAAARPQLRKAARPQTEPVQLLSAAKQPLLKQLLPVVAGAVLGILILLKKPKDSKLDIS